MGNFVETIKSLAPFLASYPAWVRVLFSVWAAATLALLLVLILARTPGQDVAEGATQDSVFLIIRNVTAYALEEPVLVRVTAKVNGLAFVYPSGTEAQWIEVGPSMSPQKFALPRSRSGYEVSFTMVAKLRTREVKFISQWKEHVTLLPFTSEYEVHGFDPQSNSRSATVDAVIMYQLLTEKH